MSDQGKANYEGYYAAMPGASPVPFEELPYAERLRWDAGACSVELWLADAPVDEDAPGSEPEPPAQWALVELMGHAQVTGSWRETVLCGRPMLEITRLDVAERRVQLVGPESVYRLTPLTEAEAMHVTRFARAAIAAAVPDDDDGEFPAGAASPGSDFEDGL